VQWPKRWQWEGQAGLRKGLLTGKSGTSRRRGVKFRGERKARRVERDFAVPVVECHCVFGCFRRNGPAFSFVQHRPASRRCSIVQLMFRVEPFASGAIDTM
jgi:hypothetical protein